MNFGTKKEDGRIKMIGIGGEYTHLMEFILKSRATAPEIEKFEFFKNPIYGISLEDEFQEKGGRWASKGLWNL